jgi:hypothetical protein
MNHLIIISKSLVNIKTVVILFHRPEFNCLCLCTTSAHDRSCESAGTCTSTDLYFTRTVSGATVGALPVVAVSRSYAGPAALLQNTLVAQVTQHRNVEGNQTDKKTATLPSLELPVATVLLTLHHCSHNHTQRLPRQYFKTPSAKIF